MLQALDRCGRKPRRGVVIQVALDANDGDPLLALEFASDVIWYGLTPAERAAAIASVVRDSGGIIRASTRDRAVRGG
jgi:hypothetical protein